MDTKIAHMRKRYGWKNEQAERRAYALIKKLPSPHVINGFSQRLEQRLAETGQKQVDEKLFYRVMEESFVDSGTSAFTHLLTVCVQQFKAAAVPGRAAHLQYGGSSHEDMESKIAFIQDRYRWDTVQSRDLAGYLLKRFSLPFLTGDAFIQTLDTLLKRHNTSTLSEEAFCRAMEEQFAAICREIFRSLMQQHLQSDG